MSAHPVRSRGRRTGAVEGAISVLVSDDQDDHPLDTATWAALAEDVLDSEGVEGDAEVSLLFVGEEAIAGLNEQFMGSGPGESTDVLSFPIDGELIGSGHSRGRDRSEPDPSRSDPEAVPLLLGDVVICPAVAARNAPQHAGSFEDEVALLVVHGILHLLGHDHAGDAERDAMQARERDLILRFHREPIRDPWG